MILRKMVVSVGRVLAILALVAGAVLFGTANSTEAVTKYARITFHVSECPENTADVFASCHDNRVADEEISVSSPTGFGKSKFTDDNGVVSFSPRAGHNYVLVVRRTSYEGVYIYCSVQNRGNLVLIDRPDDGNLSLNTTRGDIIICDLYLLTAT